MSSRQTCNTRNANKRKPVLSLDIAAVLLVYYLPLHVKACSRQLTFTTARKYSKRTLTMNNQWDLSAIQTGSLITAAEIGLNMTLQIIRSSVFSGERFTVEPYMC
jgi:hypothetical protein